MGRCNANGVQNQNQNVVIRSLQKVYTKYILHVMISTNSIMHITPRVNIIIYIRSFEGSEHKWWDAIFNISMITIHFFITALHYEHNRSGAKELTCWN